MTIESSRRVVDSRYRRCQFDLVGILFFEFSSWMRSGLTNSGWEGMQMKKLRVKKKSSMRGWSRWCINHRCKWRVKLNKWERSGKKNDWYGGKKYVYIRFLRGFMRRKHHFRLDLSIKIFLKLHLMTWVFFFQKLNELIYWINFFSILILFDENIKIIFLSIDAESNRHRTIF